MINTKIPRVITFGEVMMRLSPPDFEKFSQTEILEMQFGGGEANVAIALAYLGYPTAHVTCFPDNVIGYAATQFLRRHWVNTSFIKYKGNKLGHYFLERGAVHRPSNIVYDRDHSSFAELEPNSFDWDEIFQDAEWFHWTAITPGIGSNIAIILEEAIEVAHAKGVKISADISWRKNQWRYGKSPAGIINPLLDKCHLVIAGKFELKQLLGIDNELDFEQLAPLLMKKHSNIHYCADKTRESTNASANNIMGHLFHNGKILNSPNFEITHIVDRVGTGDAFAAGLIYGLLSETEPQKVITIAAATCALKHTIKGDANMVSEENIQELVLGNTEANINR